MLMAWPSTIVFHLINQNITITKDTESKIINVFSWKMVIIFLLSGSCYKNLRLSSYWQWRQTNLDLYNV